MHINDIKKDFKEKSMDPLLVVLANKGYQWLLTNNSEEKEATAFEEYILNNTVLLELEEVKSKKKSLRDFITWKYINYLDS
ncbi:hypothetical protein [Clostridium magnum]|uniref:Uncharacterized protein n=1 Tax=Clostridium magnum DSM 2767 TaxID=1121326 RepID=A0A162TG42_9CLOT|nr:hypothetical protein [Clostridium magnum]KZL92595.1 hypothetical protein CLMAG_24090 [Clostridium magnum DSM 2767]SHJ06082.1 hypothetical protein SAMN02745944_05292 [Clostridium magnum DSM 2767]